VTDNFDPLRNFDTLARMERTIWKENRVFTRKMRRDTKVLYAICDRNDKPKRKETQQEQ
jgi:hypothetical protein